MRKSVSRRGLLLTAMLLAIGSVAPATMAAAQAHAVPKVVIIVGPAGTATDDYRAEARAAAAVARRYTSDVTEISSPDATWPAVRSALQGASLVIYMGHGNGWPSRYRDALYPPTQDGFGLNPSAGGDDEAHQYYGEGPIAKAIQLAPNAVVLLNHLCYASGLSEPGLPEGTLAVARQRVDNFAAGFIKAGAAAVIAEAYASPALDVAQILGTNRSIQSIWLGGPTANGHAFSFDSVRSPGFVAELDPATASSGFERSIVLKHGLASSDVRASAQGVAGAGGVPVTPGPPSLVATGIHLATPTFADPPAAGTTTTLRLPFTITDRRSLPATIQASVRWDPLDVAVLPEPGATDPPTDPPGPPPAGFALVEPERVGDVVAPATIHIGKTGLSGDIALPTTPGRYRLTISLHDGDGVEYDAATQALLPVVIVRITGDVDGAIVVAPTATLVGGSQPDLPTQVVNLGSGRWGHELIAGRRRTDGAQPATWATLSGRWISLGPVDPTAAFIEMQTALPIGLLPGASADVDLPLTVPATPGAYLLVLDVLTPDDGSITAAGDAPTIVRVNVVAAVAPDPDPFLGQP